MHLQQTKGEKRKGGPQYYFHDLTDPIKLYLRQKGAVRVALVTPYGATKSDYFAVSTKHKLDTKLLPVGGRVGHDRIQQGKAKESIGESIRDWYHLPAGDFETIDVDIDIREDVFYLTPLNIKFRKKARAIELERMHKPLSFTMDYVSPLWIDQIIHIAKCNKGIVEWSISEICRTPNKMRALGPISSKTIPA
jgi:hypothetical protein